MQKNAIGFVEKLLIVNQRIGIYIMMLIDLPWSIKFNENIFFFIENNFIEIG